MAVTLVLAGCGGEGGTTGLTVATTTPTSTSKATSTVVTGPDGSVTAIATVPGAEADPPPKTRGNGAQDFRAYVDESLPVLRPVMGYDEMRSRLSDAVGGLSPQPDSTWDKAAEQIDDIADDMSATAVAMQDIAAPRDMVAEHQELVRAYWASAGFFRGMSDALEEQDADALQSALASDGSATQPRAWLTAMGEHSDALDVALPVWLDRYVTALG